MAMILADTAAENAAVRAALKAAISAGAEWDAPQAAEARQLTCDAGWSWDFTTWEDALADFEGMLALADATVPMARGRYYPFHPEAIEPGATVDYRNDEDWCDGEAPDDEIWNDAEERLARRGLRLHDTGGGYVVVANNDR